MVKMKKTNTISKSGYIDLMLTTSIGFALAFRFACFSGIYGMTLLQSKLIFWGLVILLFFLGIYITFEKGRTYTNLFANVAFPIELYIVISTYRYISERYNIVFIIALIISLLYSALVLFQKIKHKEQSKEIILHRIKCALLGTRTIVAVLLVFVTLPVCIGNVFGHQLIRSDVEAKVENTEDEKWSLSNNIETIALLHEDNWATLNLSERLDVLAVVKNVEMRYFGVPHEVNLEAGTLEDGVAGLYNHKANLIVIDIEYLKSADSMDVLRTILHECRHVYDRMCVDMYNQLSGEYKNMLLFNNVATFSKEFSDYTDADEDALGYYTQNIEVVAREYSKAAAIEYMMEIEEYLQDPDDVTMEE